MNSLTEMQQIERDSDDNEGPKSQEHNASN